MMTHLGVGDRPAGPVEAVAKVHLDLARADQVDHEWRAVEADDVDPAGRVGGGDRRHDELRHAVVDADDVGQLGIGHDGRLHRRLDLGAPVGDRHVDELVLMPGPYVSNSIRCRSSWRRSTRSPWRPSPGRGPW